MVGESTYYKELLLARTLAETTPRKKHYYNGVTLGLKHCHSGICDKAFMCDSNDDAAQIALFKKGYRDGHRKMQSAKRGRKSKGDCSLTRIVVSSALRKELEDLAFKENVDLAELRRRAYTFYVKTRK